MIYVIGEILVDLLNEKNNLFSYHAGGAPYNVASMIASLGGKVAFQGSVGKDVFGKLLLEDVKKRNFYKSLIKVNYRCNTTLATVYLDSNNERYFSFMRKQNTDIYFGEIDEKIIKKSNVVHFGSLMISSSKGMKFLISSMKKVKKQGKLVSFDANYRNDIMSSKIAYSRYKKIIKYVDILKLSEDEVKILTKEDKFEDGLNLLKQFVNIVVITKGKNGSVLYLDNETINVPALEIDMIDSTGAGDGFFGGLLYYYDYLISNNLLLDWKEILKFANACGAFVAMHKGAIDNLPTKEEILELLD